MNTTLAILLLAIHAAAQVPLPLLGVGAPASNATNQPNALVVMGGVVDLGPISVEAPVRVLVAIFNPSAITRRVLGRAAGHGLAPVIMDVPLLGLDIPPGGFVEVPLVLDPKVLVRDRSLRVGIPTDDPNGPRIPLTITGLCQAQPVACDWAQGCVVGKSPAMTQPVSTVEPVNLVFSVDQSRYGPINQWWVEDRTAPLVIEETPGWDGASGTWRGRLVLAHSAVPPARPSGSTKVFVSTRSGHTGYTTVQWAVLK